MENTAAAFAAIFASRKAKGRANFGRAFRGRRSKPRYLNVEAPMHRQVRPLDNTERKRRKKGQNDRVSAAVTLFPSFPLGVIYWSHVSEHRALNV